MYLFKVSERITVVVINVYSICAYDKWEDGKEAWNFEGICGIFIKDGAEWKKRSKVDYRYLNR